MSKIGNKLRIGALLLLSMLMLMLINIDIAHAGPLKEDGIMTCATDLNIEFKKDEIIAKLDESKRIVPLSDFIGKKIEIPVVFNILYDSTMNEEKALALREKNLEEIKKIEYPNIYCLFYIFNS